MQIVGSATTCKCPSFNHHFAIAVDTDSINGPTQHRPKIIHPLWMAQERRVLHSPDSLFLGAIPFGCIFGRLVRQIGSMRFSGIAERADRLNNDGHDHSTHERGASEPGQRLQRRREQPNQNRQHVRQKSIAPTDTLRPMCNRIEQYLYEHRRTQQASQQSPRRIAKNALAIQREKQQKGRKNKQPLHGTEQQRSQTLWGSRHGRTRAPCVHIDVVAAHIRADKYQVIYKHENHRRQCASKEKPVFPSCPNQCIGGKTCRQQRVRLAIACNQSTHQAQPQRTPWSTALAG